MEFPPPPLLAYWWMLERGEEQLHSKKIRSSSTIESVLQAQVSAPKIFRNWNRPRGSACAGITNGPKFSGYDPSTLDSPNSVCVRGLVENICINNPKCRTKVCGVVFSIPWPVSELLAFCVPLKSEIANTEQRPKRGRSRVLFCYFSILSFHGWLLRF